MPRNARIVVAGVPHHVTQRGTNRQLTFLTRADRLAYLRLLREHSRQADLRILAYCLMPNHIHLVAIPEQEGSLAVALRRAHGRYAQYFNARKLRTGHLWQNRFYSCAMSESHLWTAVRYVELNPIRAGLAEAPEEYEWSSADSHLRGEDRARLLDMRFWEECGGASQWRELLGRSLDDTDLKRLRSATHSGKPLVDNEIDDRQQASTALRKGPSSDAPQDTQHEDSFTVAF